MSTVAPLKTPFPYFGGKSTVADLVWERLGDVDNYVEPFAGGSAVLLRRPQPGKIETINDANHYIVNFWRAVQRDPAGVAAFADHPVTEADLHARHRYLVLGPAAETFKRSIEADPSYCNPRFAGWWVWGQCCWIGGGWCETNVRTTEQRNRPQLHGMGQGVAAQSQSLQLPDLAGDAGAFGRGVVSSAGHKKRLPCDSDKIGCGVNAKMPRVDARGNGGGVVSKLPLLSSHDGNGTGVNVLSAGRPQLGDAFDIGRGVNGNGSTRVCQARRSWLIAWMERLRDRLRLVRVCYGHWDRICDSHTTMTRLGVTGAFVDPPYAKDCRRTQQWIAYLLGEGEAPADSRSQSNRSGNLYTGDQSQDIDRLVAEVNVWARKWGANDKVRLAICGYEGEHDSLEGLGWEVVPWKAHGGYGNRNAANQNKHRERIWFSPACLNGNGGQRELF